MAGNHLDTLQLEIQNELDVPPFFIVGSPRSGTTMLRLMVNSHSQLAVPFESAFLSIYQNKRPFNKELVLDELAEEKFTKKGNIIEDRAAILDRDPTNFPELIDAVFTSWAHRRGKLFWGVKTPMYVLQMDLLRQFFPRSKFIHIIRDGRGVAVSALKLKWGRTNIIKAAEDWRLRVLLGHKMGGMIGDDYKEVRYEDLVLNPASVLQEICDFLGVSYEGSMLDFHKKAETEMPQESMQWHKNSVSTPSTDKITAWKTKLSYTDQILFAEKAGDVLEMFGYECEGYTPTIRSRLKTLRLMAKQKFRSRW